MGECSDQFVIFVPWKNPRIGMIDHTDNRTEQTSSSLPASIERYPQLTANCNRLSLSGFSFHITKFGNESCFVTTLTPGFSKIRTY